MIQITVHLFTFMTFLCLRASSQINTGEILETRRCRTVCDYQHYHNVSQMFGVLHFYVKAKNDAHVELRNAKQVYEVIIGGWKNNQSVIRKNKSSIGEVPILTKNILSEREYKGFWIKWNDNEITVSEEENLDYPFMAIKGRDSFNITTYAIRTTYNATGFWIMEDIGWYPYEVLNGPAKWITKSRGKIPPNAVPAGLDITGEQLYVGRAIYKGALLPGKVVPSHGLCYVTWNGKEHGISHYQVLCGFNGIWKAGSKFYPKLPDYSFVSGSTDIGEKVFIGRARHNGILVVGQIYNDVCKIPYGRKEITYEVYDVLTEVKGYQTKYYYNKWTGLRTRRYR